MDPRAHRNRWTASLLATWLLLGGPLWAQDQVEETDELPDDINEEFECPEAEEGENVEDMDERCIKLERAEVNDTADIDTDSTADNQEVDRRYVLSGDFRTLANHIDRNNRRDEFLAETTGQARLRLRGTLRLPEHIGFGARIAGKCSTYNCDLEWVNDYAAPVTNGLANGQFTFDEFFVHLYSANTFDLTLGRQQTRMVLRGGVFSRSLDRNNSNNTNVNWTDGAHFRLRERRGWHGHVVVEYNSAEGSGSVRRGQLDFTPSSATTSYWYGAENLIPVGPVVQRSVSITYLPNALLVDGDIDGRRDTYIGYVGRMAFRWPLQTDGPFFRGGFEVGYAPNVPTAEGANLESDAEGLAWNVTASIMNFRPRHNIGVFYAHTGAGWLISPNFVQNEQAFEIRYQWRRRIRAAIDFRVRWREDLEQLTTAIRKRDRFDAFLRFTWQFEMN